MSNVKVGGACWDIDYAEKMLSTISRLDAEDTPWFFATHSPITYISDKTDSTQDDLFNQLFAIKREDYLVVVNGEPGSGKSQLINWLKLRFDKALRKGQTAGIANTQMRTVLVRRRSGSLKDALQQLIEQLPEFDNYLQKIQTAIDVVAGDKANRRLAFELSECLKEESNNAPQGLSTLHEAFLHPRSMAHLCRSGGAIDLNIRQLIEKSDATQRESLPSFTERDFIFPPSVQIGDGLSERLSDEDPEFRIIAAELSSRYLRLAIAALTGLKGDTLTELFRNIRRDLKERGGSLALFVEDVSTLSVLDTELVNALQPTNDSTLSPLISVLGMTMGAFRNLPTNLIQRIDKTLELSDSSSFRNSDSDPSRVDKFVGRYLNALRLGESKINSLMEDIDEQDGIQHSACTECIQRENCFGAFGSVEIDNTVVGLYPLSEGTSIRLLNGLNDEQLPKTPRTLLQYILAKLLKNTASDWTGRSIGLEVRPRTPIDLAEEEQQLLARWSSEQRSRLSYLVYYWSGEDSIKNSIGSLEPKLPWWGLERFESNIPRRNGNVTPVVLGPKISPKRPIDSPKAEDARYMEITGRLDQWFQQNSVLKKDADFRAILLKAIRQSIQLEEVRVPSNRIQRFTFSSLTSGNIEIEDQTTRAAVASRVRFKFDRSEETYNILRNLIDFEYRGGNSWNFSGGEVARRGYGMWLSRNHLRLIAAYGFENSSRNISLTIAVKFLRFAYQLSYRKGLPSDIGEALEALMCFTPGKNHCLTNDLLKISDDLPTRVQNIRDELMDELAVRQGSGSILYIDSRFIINNLSGSSFLELSSTDKLVNKTEFPSIASLCSSSQWNRLPDILSAEKSAVADKLKLVNAVLRNWEILTDPIGDGIRNFLTSARSVIQALESANQSIGNSQLQKQIGDLQPAVVMGHVNAIVSGSLSVNDENKSILGLDVKAFLHSALFISDINETLSRTEATLAEKFLNVVTSIDVDNARNGALSSLESLKRLVPIEGNEDGTKI